VRIPAQSKVAFVGPTGAGKSTLFQLLLRFYDVTAGGIFFDDTDIRSVSVAALRRQLGVVFQETFLFDVSVRENIAIGMPSASVEEIEAAARAAGIHDFVMSLPRGYDTQVGERGVRLSGGQRQRLAIARAILRRPQVLLLDEATAALDPRTERAVMAAASKAGEGRTTIAVTHRLTSVVDYDAIHVVVDGRIVESGRHEELLARGGVYADLWTEQTGQLLALPGGIDVAEALARIPLFQALSEQDLAQVVARMREVHLEPGQTMAEADALCLLTDGQARVLPPTGSEPSAPPTRLGPGDAFGLAALLGNRTGGVLEAVSKVDLVALDALDLAHLMLVIPALPAALAAHTSAGPRDGIRLSRPVLRPWPVSPQPRSNADVSLSRPAASWAQPPVRRDAARVDVMGGAP
jgi:ABC-type phosphate transport system ATPase subunit